MPQLLRSALGAAALLLSTSVLAVDDGTKEAPPADSETNDSATYSGVGLSKISTDFTNVEDAINLNVVIGFRIPTVNWFGVELELLTSVIPGQVKPEECQSTGGGGGGGPLDPIFGGGDEGTSGCVRNAQSDFGVNSAGVYAVLRSPGRYYVMGKTGYRYLTSSLEGLNEDRSGSAYAGGVGYRWNPRKNNGAEFYYNKLTDSLDYYGFNISYGFGGRD